MTEQTEPGQKAHDTGGVTIASNNTAIILAMVALVIMVIIAAVTLVIFGPDDGSMLLIILLIGFVGPTIVGLLNYMTTKQTATEIKELKVVVDGRLTKFVEEATGRAAADATVIAAAIAKDLAAKNSALARDLASHVAAELAARALLAAPRGIVPVETRTEAKRGTETG